MMQIYSYSFFDGRLSIFEGFGAEKGEMEGFAEFSV